MSCSSVGRGFSGHFGWREDGELATFGAQGELAAAVTLLDEACADECACTIALGVGGHVGEAVEVGAVAFEAEHTIGVGVQQRVSALGPAARELETAGEGVGCDELTDRGGVRRGELNDVFEGAQGEVHR